MPGDGGSGFCWQIGRHTVFGTTVRLHHLSPSDGSVDASVVPEPVQVNATGQRLPPVGMRPASQRFSW
ncbi:protein of unknown function [Cupriavidus taiwanensis]|nr:protein of unknown function [Cupriavidus taiwanensis]SPC18400.1 hypothetical protein CT19431_MP30325 [Cupriavidus taiwanensis]